MANLRKSTYTCKMMIVALIPYQKENKKKDKFALLIYYSMNLNCKIDACARLDLLPQQRRRLTAK